MKRCALLLAVAASALACEGRPVFDPRPIGIARRLDGGRADAMGVSDIGTRGGDGGNTTDTGNVGDFDASIFDAGPLDIGGDLSDVGGADSNTDAQPSDATSIDAGASDASAMDTGFTDAGATGCTTNAQCSAPKIECVNPKADTNGAFQPCNGTCTGGVCREPCDPFSPNTVCPSGQSCLFVGSTSLVPNRGLCVTAGTGGTQGQSCTATFDSLGNVVSDTCDATRNYQCFGVIPSLPNGACARICSTSEQELCTSLGSQYDCTGTGIGQCLVPPPSIGDIGIACTTAAGCQGGLCASALGKSCSFDCGGLNQCPSTSICVVFTGSTMPICAYRCTPGTNSSATCSARNPAAPNCTDVGGGDGVCTP